MRSSLFKVCFGFLFTAQDNNFSIRMANHLQSPVTMSGVFIKASLLLALLTEQKTLNTEQLTPRALKALSIEHMKYDTSHIHLTGSTMAKPAWLINKLFKNQNETLKWC